MAQPKARLYQRLRTKRFPWVACEMAKNGSPKPHPDAFQFGIRYTIDGQRKLDPAATLDGAAMNPDKVQPPEPLASEKSEGTQPKDTPQEDPDRVRGEVFKRMFPDRPKKSPE